MPALQELWPGRRRFDARVCPARSDDVALAAPDEVRDDHRRVVGAPPAVLALERPVDVRVRNEAPDEGPRKDERDADAEADVEAAARRSVRVLAESREGANISRGCPVDGGNRAYEHRHPNDPEDRLPPHQLPEQRRSSVSGSMKEESNQLEYSNNLICVVELTELDTVCATRGRAESQLRRCPR